MRMFAIYMFLFLPSFCFCVQKTCRILEEVVRMKQNYAFSGKIVRVKTTRERIQACPKEQPECCGNSGCCDARGTKLLIIVCVGVACSLLTLAVVSVFVYSLMFNRSQKQHSISEEDKEAMDSTALPRYDMDSYLRSAGFDPDVLQDKGGPDSAIQPMEVSSSSSSSSDDSSGSDSSDSETLGV